MKFARYLAHGEISYGVVEGDSVKQLTTSPFEDYEGYGPHAYAV